MTAALIVSRLVSFCVAIYLTINSIKPEAHLGIGEQNRPVFWASVVWGVWFLTMGFVV